MVDRSGRVLGAIGPRAVAQPWWPEAAPIVDAFPGFTVLRLLAAEPDPEGKMGGRVTYVAQCDDAGSAPDGLRPWHGELVDHRLRAPWAEPGGPAADLEWVARQVTVTGRPRQHKTWNLSAIWSIPTTDGLVWLKSVPPFFGHEATVLEHLGHQFGSAVPRLLAAEGHRLLLADLPGRDGHGVSGTELTALLDVLVDHQVAMSATPGVVESLVAGGVPDLTTAVLAEVVPETIDRLVSEGDRRRPRFETLLDELDDRLATADALGPPPTLVHGDAHGGNCRVGAERPLWFDWGDSSIGSPLLDLACDWDKSPEVMAHWLARWEDQAPDAGQAWDALRPVAAVLAARVYQRFLDRIEPSEHIYHRDDVPEALDRAAELLGDGR